MERTDFYTIIETWVARPKRRIGTNEIPEVHAAIGTTVGEVRQDNQDRAVIARFSDNSIHERSFVACIVCDGMGGMIDGGRCADIAVASFLESLIGLRQAVSVDAIKGAIHRTNDAVFSQYKGRGGTTLTALVFTATGAWAVTIGDTRLYEITASRKLQQLSTDDTIAGELKRLRGSQQDAALEPFSNRLAQFVGLGEGIEPRIQLIKRDAPDSTFLIMTDGIRIIGDWAFERLTAATSSLTILTSRLIHLSNWCGGDDNSSLICLARDNDRPLLQFSRYKYDSLELWDAFSQLHIALEPENFRENRAVPRRGEIGPVVGVRTPSHNTVAQPQRKHSSRKPKRPDGSKPGLPVARGKPESPRQKQFEIEIVEGPKTDASVPEQRQPNEDLPTGDNRPSQESGDPEKPER